MGQVVIGRQVQASLDLGPLQDLIVTATHHKRQSGQISEDGSCPILSIKAQQNTFFGRMMRLEVALNSHYSPTQFCSVLTVARVSKRPEKLMRMRLQNRGAAPHHFPSFAPGVAGCA